MNKCKGDIKSCFHFGCHNLGRCWVKSQSPIKEYPKVLIPKLKEGRKLRVCSFEKERCNNKHICSILGQCAREHEAIKGNLNLVECFKRPLSRKEAIKIFEQVVKLKVPFKNRKREYKHLE